MCRSVLHKSFFILTMCQSVCRSFDPSLYDVPKFPSLYDVPKLCRQSYCELRHIVILYSACVAHFGTTCYRVKTDKDLVMTSRVVYIMVAGGCDDIREYGTAMGSRRFFGRGVQRYRRRRTVRFRRHKFVRRRRPALRGAWRRRAGAEYRRIRDRVLRAS